jgi:PAS domain S-box-containing protein
MKLNFKILSAIILVLIFFSVKTLALFEIFESTKETRLIEFLTLLTLLTFIPFFYCIIKDLFEKQKESLMFVKYSKKLNQSLINQTHNNLFYQGKIKDGAKTLTKEITNGIDTDRCSIWLYNEDKTSIKCVQLYVKSEDKWYEDIELFKKDFTPYFEHLEIDPIIIANDAELHSATNCFTDTYLKPLNIKSMLDVPIIHKGNTIGVICIESLSLRNWQLVEVNFAQLISSIFSFSYSVKEINKLTNELLEFDKFVDSSVLVSRADANGKITYVNKKFEDVSGWKLKDVIGKDHNIVNSGKHDKDFWKGMYNVVLNHKSIWNSVVINKTKKGELYWVDSYIKGEFDEDGKLKGFMSLRYDISDVVKSSMKIKKQNTYLEHAAKILRHDMHSGINTYIPRGVSSLERRLPQKDIERLKIEAPLKMIKEGLKHTQKVYKGVYEFTNLVKPDTCLTKENFDLKQILRNYLESTSYNSQVIIDDLVNADVNEPLFCTAIDNLIRNGLKYNDSDNKFVKIFMEKKCLCIQDNGRGLTQEEFEYLSQPYTRKENQKEAGTGLGLNICSAIIKEHGFSISCEKNEIGTKMKIKIL